jgi:hypothetical protein
MAERLCADELKLNQIYTLMLAYNYRTQNRLTMRMATRVTAMALADGNLRDIEFDTIDDQHYATIASFEATLDQSGLWVPMAGTDGGGVAMTIEGTLEGLMTAYQSLNCTQRQLYKSQLQC